MRSRKTLPLPRNDPRKTLSQYKRDVINAMRHLLPLEISKRGDKMCKRRREQRDRFSLRRGGGTFPFDIPSAVNPSSRETTPRKTVERRWTWNRRGGGGNLLRKRGTDFIKWQYLRRRRRRRNVKSFTFSSFLLSDFRFHSVQLAPDLSLLPLPVMRNHAFRFCSHRNEIRVVHFLPFFSSHI